MPAISQPMTWAQVKSAAPDAQVDVVVSVAELPTPDLLAGTFLESDEADPFTTYRRTAHPLRLRWTSSTRIVMGDASDLQPGALVRARGPRLADDLVDAQHLVILTRVARILDS
jgi:hypothetical protein